MKQPPISPFIFSACILFSSSLALADESEYQFSQEPYFQPMNAEENEESGQEAMGYDGGYPGNEIYDTRQFDDGEQEFVDGDSYEVEYESDGYYYTPDEYEDEGER